MKRLKWLLLFYYEYCAFFSWGSLLHKSIFSCFPYLHNSLVAVKEQGVHVSSKYTCGRVTIREGVKHLRHKKSTTGRKVTFLVFIVVVDEITKVTVVTLQSDFRHLSTLLLLQKMRCPPKDNQGLVNWSHLIPVNGSTPPKLVCWVE